MDTDNTNKGTTVAFNTMADQNKILKPGEAKVIRSYSVRHYDLYNASLFKYDSHRTLRRDWQRLKKTEAPHLKTTVYIRGYMFYFVKQSRTIMVFHKAKELNKVLDILQEITKRNLSAFKNV